MPKIRQEKLLRSSYKEGKFYFWDRDIPKKELCAVISGEVLSETISG